MALIVFRGKEGELLGDRFRLIAEVGKGSFGEVWQACRLKDGAVVALKTPKDQGKGEEVLRQESDVIKDIYHPNVVQVYGYHNIDAFDLFSLYQLGQYYYMMGDRRRASEYFQRVLDADKQGPYAEKVRQLTDAFLVYNR